MKRPRKPFAEGFMSDFPQLLEVRLIGSKCNSCGIVLFGKREECENCGGQDLQNMTFSKRGKVYAYTVQRAAPPQPYRVGPDPENWIPRPVAWVDLPEGARILAILDCRPEEVEIGMDVQLVVGKGWEEGENDIVMYKFRPVKARER